ncbi:MAG: sugar porter family MFS transporter [Bryobacteraceae bacterium]|nr:sugar porter family MFS transporter [Bryobacteraceae bacterium]
MTSYAWWVSLVAATAGLLFGYDIAVINGGLILLRAEFTLSEAQSETAASSLLFGCVLGASIAGWLSDRFGRRRLLMVAALLFGLSALAAALPRNLPEFVVARFAGGVAVGVASLLAPLYIAEVSPPKVRGRLVSLNQMAIVSGILLAYFVNWLLSFQGQSSWRWMFAAAAVPSLAFFVALFFVPESPRWLVEKGRDQEALHVLGKVGAANEFRAIREAIAEEQGTLAQLFQPGWRRALAVAVALAVLQQWTGINTVLFYGSIIFREQVGNYSDSAAIGVNVVVGLINFFATLVAIWLIDRVGRRPLLLISAGAMGACLVTLALAFLRQPPPGELILAVIGICVAAFAIGLGPGTWVVLSEIFPTRIRGRAMSIATISLWSACVVLTFTFLSLVRAVTITGAFAIYAAMCAIEIVVLWKWTPETKEKTLEEIEGLWTTAKRTASAGG